MEKLEFKNYGLEELSSKELQETEGGSFLLFLVGVIVGIAIGALIADIQNG